jgi:hypothetical protein
MSAIIGIGSSFAKAPINTLGSGFLKSIQNVISASKPTLPFIPKSVLPARTGLTGIKGVVSGVSKNLAISAGTGLVITSLLSLTQGGQNIVTTSGKAVQNVTDVTKDVTGIIKSNPIIPLGLIALAALLLIVVLKK